MLLKLALVGAYLLPISHAEWPVDCFETIRHRRLSGAFPFSDSSSGTLKDCLRHCAQSGAEPEPGLDLIHDSSSHFFRRKGACEEPKKELRSVAEVSRRVSDRSSKRSRPELLGEVAKAPPRWLSWAAWSRCSADCGPGRKSRVRECTRPKKCIFGAKMESRICDAGPCPISHALRGQLRDSGSWERWSSWSECAATCGSSYRSRKRRCSNPEEPEACPEGSTIQLGLCSASVCGVSPVSAGSFNSVVGLPPSWSLWTACSVSCGSGIHVRSRPCPNPALCGSVTSSDVQSCVGPLGPACGDRGSSLRRAQPGAAWSPWREWTTCECGAGDVVGVRMRIRTCAQVFACPGNGFEILDCPCTGTPVTLPPRTPPPVGPTWSVWGAWGPCISGQRNRRRGCSVFNACPGLDSQRENCAQQPLTPFPDRPGEWTQWTQWGQCSLTCSAGTRQRRRTCPSGFTCRPSFNNPKVFPGGAGAEVEQDICGRPCDGLLSWAPWTPWSSCTKTCGGGERVRRRRCPEFLRCGEGVDTEVATCGVVPCPGTWGLWADWSDCSADCGQGVRTRARLCRSEPCVGENMDMRECFREACVGTFGDWGPWTNCDVTCGDGRHTRQRRCSLGPGRCAGGESSQEERCTAGSCAEWGPWRDGRCSVTCDSGTQERTRTCSLGPGRCIGADRDRPTPCIEQPCPANWGPWREESCSVTCGNGQRRRSRQCPIRGRCGAGADSDSISCFERDCIGDWSPWQEGRCSVTCDRGQRQRTRQCSLGPGRCGTGQSSDSVPCQEPQCVVPEWEPWVPGPCSVTCGRGSRQRTRRCSVGPGACGFGPERDTQDCTEQPCPEWGPWRDGTCSVTCGIGQLPRTRQCSAGPGRCGFGQATDSTDCFEPTCERPEWLQWAEGRCSVTCGRGQRQRTRRCSLGPGRCSPGLATDSVACSEPVCEVAVWERWVEGACSVTCDRGQRQRTRRCSLGPGRCSPGSATDFVDCVEPACQVPVWERWTEGTCSVTCDRGQRQRTRRCSLGPGRCSPGSATDFVACIEPACPPECQPWEPWQCSTTCGPGVRSRSRDCRPGGGPADERTACQNPACPVWSQWSAWRCGVTCGPGTETRQRRCDGGTGLCGPPNDAFDSRPCQATYCPTTPPPCGTWSLWTAWRCSVTCDIGTQTRTRTCPRGVGGCCGGESSERGSCAPGECPVDWSAWRQWGLCSATCDCSQPSAGMTGTRQRTRSCPRPGACPGSPQGQEPCLERQCPRDWGAWGAWQCTVTCGDGSAVRRRDCPANFCPGQAQEDRVCNAPPCIEAGWGQWRPWSSCTTSCGPGSVSRTRPCVTRYLACIGPFIEVKECDQPRSNCFGPNWAAWEQWGQCSLSCGGGQRTRRRICPQGAGACGVGSTDNEICNASQCSAVRGQFREWEPWTACTRTCGGGRRWRKRNCNIFNACDGFNSQSESEFCNVSGCLSDRRRKVLDPPVTSYRRLFENSIFVTSDNG